MNTETAPRAGRARRFAFFAVLILFALTHYPVPLFAILGWFIEEGATSHRVHEIVFGFIFTMNLVGLLAQLRKPELRVAQMYQVFIISWLLVATTLIVDREIFINVVFFFVLPPVLVILHPARDQLLRPVINLSRVLLILLLAAAIPWVYYAVNEFRIGLDASRVATPVFEIVENRLPDDATEDEFEDALLAELRRATDSNEEFEAAQHSGHWSAMGAFALIILGLAGVGALRPTGWRVPAWCAGLSAILYGSASFANPGDASSATSLWALLAIVWGVVFILATERERREFQPAGEAVGQPAPA
ncbi:MAG: hypothetical protein ACRDJ2_06735 [Actinomycetota bacterium]